MKVLLLAKTLQKGGAATGANNLLDALRSAGADVVVKDGSAQKSYNFVSLLRSLERIYERAFYGYEAHCLRLGPPTFNLLSLYEEYHPDVIQLCDVSGNIIRFSDIAKVNCPIVHRMSDFWPYHGAYHYADNVPQKLSLAEYLLRKTIYDRKSFPTVRVAPSHWLANRLGGQNICVIRNAVNIPSTFTPRQITLNPLRIGFVANPINLERKGFNALSNVINQLSSKPIKLELNLFGYIHPNEVPSFGKVEVKAHGIFKKSDIARVYNSFDILVCPSREDNSPNVVTEALAHGVPVIAQAGTGMDSYLQPKFSALIDFYNKPSIAGSNFLLAIQFLTENYATASQAAIDYVYQELRPEIIGGEYLKLYQTLISKQKE